MYSGKTAHHHFCVSNQMKKDLKKWGIEATVLYDRPPDIFRDLNHLERHKIYSKISTVQVDVNEEKTPFTNLLEKEQKVIEREDRPGLIISSTSWTKDEDFSILLNAVKDLDKKASETNGFPNLEFIITGKGPEKEKYEQEIKIIKLQKCRIQTKWLTSEDYPKLLGASDLGICLHFSSSGLDLPMKIVDMFGVGLPVCAIYYQTLPELVENDKNGILFKNSQELSDIMFDLFKNFPKEKNKLDEMRSNIKEFQSYRWDDEWNKKAFPIFASN